MMQLHRVGVLALPALLLSSLVGCGAGVPAAPNSIPTVAPTPVSPARQLLATLPADAGGIHFGSYRIIDNKLNVGHPVDDVLQELDKERADAASVFRYTEDAQIGATSVDGIDGARLLQAFVDNWNALAVIRRWQRPAAGTTGWGLAYRGGGLTVVYGSGDVVYLVSVASSDPLELEAVLADMPPGGA